MKPLIGITLGSRTKTEKIQQYVDFVAREGADTVVLLPGTSIPELSGLLLGGGADIDPAEYGEPLDGSVDVEPERDAYERPIAGRALRDGVPVLGICRGHQLLNVIQGGKLTQHLPEHKPESHTVEVGGRLADILGKDSLQVNSTHHQGVLAGQVAPSLKALATSCDGIVEALEGPGWTISVQWHPERVAEVDPANAKLAAAFVEAARSSRAALSRVR